MKNKENKRTYTVLNEEQQKLVSDNHNLVFYCLRKMGLTEAAEFGTKFSEDWYGLACIALCNAAHDYDKDKGAFSTFACTYIRTYLLKWFRYYKTNKVVPEGLLIYPDAYEGHEEDEMGTIGWSFFPSCMDTEQEAVDNAYIDGIVSAEKREIDKKILSLYWEGYGFVEIGKIIGKSRPCVNQRFARIAERIKQNPKRVIW